MNIQSDYQFQFKLKNVTKDDAQNFLREVYASQTNPWYMAGVLYSAVSPKYFDVDIVCSFYNKDHLDSFLADTKWWPIYSSYLKTLGG